MFTGYDQFLDLLNVKYFMKSLQTLEFFVRNVSIQVIMNRKSTFMKVAQQVYSSFAQHGCKVLKLWKHLIDRLNSQQIGITTVHLALIKLCIHCQFFKLSLHIITIPALPISISTVNYQQFLLNSALTYIQFQRYKQSIQSLTLAINLNSHDFKISFQILNLLSIISNVVGLKFNGKDYHVEFDRIKVIAQIDISDERSQQVRQIRFQFQLFKAICDCKKLQSEEIRHLKYIHLFTLYSKINKKANGLKRYINTQIKNQNIYRIKCTEIKNEPIDSFQSIRDLNKSQSIYKYDSKDKIMYFSHKLSDQSQLDKLLNKTCVMQKIIENRPLDNNKMSQIKTGRSSFGGF